MCESRCVRVMPIHSERQGLDSSQNKPGNLRSERPAEELGRDRSYMFCTFRGGNKQTGRQITVSAKVFGAAMDDNIHAELNGPLIEWCRESIVCYGDDACRTSDVGRRLKVGDLQQRIGG